MSAYAIETLIGTGLLASAYVGVMYALPLWIVRWCER